MKHTSTRELFGYWDMQRGTRAAPERDDIDPAAIRHVLADTFVLADDFTGDSRFRLAGTKVCALFARELKDVRFLDLWDAQSVASMQDLLAIVSDENLGVVAGVTAVSSAGNEIEMELLLLPLARRGHARVRAVGVLVPLTQPYWVGAEPLRDLRLGTLRHMGERMPALPSLTAAQPGGRQRRGFVVYDGGRSRVQDNDAA
ncbi:MAG: PAS domain-containing protein [Rhizobiales bacterium]|nr:PAS domain-containing protein [Hyphomicrobiales bacterium]OJY43867.1 MAG: hypothetical protein BGP08_14835 [Rhizobiales bacterium 64-17]